MLVSSDGAHGGDFGQAGANGSAAVGGRRVEPEELGGHSSGVDPLDVYKRQVLTTVPANLEEAFVSVVSGEPRR